MKLKRLALLLCLLSAIPLALTACIRPHKPPIRQGNLINEKDMQQLELGMTKEQVEFLIGRPILSEPFDQSHWKYVYLSYIGYQEPIKKKMILEFDGETLVKIDGSIVDSGVNQESAAQVQ